MLNSIKAVIFDMDGVIIDSEPLWRQVMIKNFVEIGIPFNEDTCRITTGLRFEEVAEYWFNIHHIHSIDVKVFSQKVIDNLCELISKEGKLMPGVFETIQYIKNQGIKIGLATSSNHQLMNHVLKTLNIHHFFDAICSAEFMNYGKPHPEVFLSCAEKLNCNPKQCLAIEDSVNGLISAKSAQMKVLVVPDKESKHKIAFEIADYRLESLEEFIRKCN
jgi:mannitol-1-/sugar-/sorbitol-6-/2-deoxyglucose-6-phosphatase